MSVAELNPWACALFLVAAFVIAGVCQAVWLASPRSWRFGSPIDGSRAFRGRRLLGDNKTWRGFVVMVPATGASFGLLSAVGSTRVAGLWPLSSIGYVGLGLLAGLGFMAGELPNSFIKRQLDIPSGAPARGPVGRPLWFVIDRIDSAAGMMIVLGLAVPVPWQTWGYVALIGPALHGLFSVLVYRLGGKARAA